MPTGAEEFMKYLHLAASCFGLSCKEVFDIVLSGINEELPFEEIDAKMCMIAEAKKQKETRTA